MVENSLSHGTIAFRERSMFDKKSDSVQGEMVYKMLMEIGREFLEGGDKKSLTNS